MQCQHLICRSFLPLFGRPFFQLPKCHILTVFWLSGHTRSGYKGVGPLCWGQRSLLIVEVMSPALEGGGDDTKANEKWLLLICAG